ncbi:hypothetical protein A9Q76_06395 [Arcobacter sp. 31_11_sub10_T18]|nr:hypothetical protein A9Q76_06395 [Arcobacter sp. 31_11_sub10_T18]
MKEITQKDKLKDILHSTLHLYSYLSDENILSKSIDNSSFKANELNSHFENTQEIKSLFHNLNKNIDINDIVSKLTEIESFSSIMDTSLSGVENESNGSLNIEEYVRDLKVVNARNLKLIRELYMMLDSKEFKTEFTD